MGFVEINKNIAQLKYGEISLPPFGRITFKLGK